MALCEQVLSIQTGILSSLDQIQSTPSPWVGRFGDHRVPVSVWSSVPVGSERFLVEVG